MKKEKSKYVDSETVFISSALIIVFLCMFTLAITDIFDSVDNTPEKSKHECVYFKKDTKRVMVIPFYYRYEDVLICTECGQEYEN